MGGVQLRQAVHVRAQACSACAASGILHAEQPVPPAAGTGTCSVHRIKWVRSDRTRHDVHRKVQELVVAGDVGRVGVAVVRAVCRAAAVVVELELARLGPLRSRVPIVSAEKPASLSGLLSRWLRTSMSAIKLVEYVQQVRCVTSTTSLHKPGECCQV